LTLVQYHVVELKTIASAWEIECSNNNRIKCWYYWWIPQNSKFVFIKQSHEETYYNGLFL